MIKVEKFNRTHIKNFQPESIIGDLELTLIQNAMDPQKDMITLYNEEERVVSILGVNHLRIGVGEVWLLRSDIINQHKFEFAKAVKKLINYCHDFMGLHRIELAVDCNWKEGYKWAEFLGFTFESIAKAYDYHMNDHQIFVSIRRVDNG